MTNATPTLAYLAALGSYLRGAEESALLWAYEHGREALDSGAGVLELGAVHRDAVATLMEEAEDGAEAARIHSAAWAFYAEIVAPVEMALRGYQQSNESLRSLAATLDEQVRSRTRDLDESLEELKRADNTRRLLLERLMSAQEDERRRIAGDIHDDSIQVITAAYLRVELIRHAVGDAHAETLGKLDEALRAAIDRLRHLVFELRPAMLDTAGLAATIQEHLDQWARQSGAEYTLANRLHREPGALPRTTLYRIAAEALTNVRKHARATHVVVDLADRAGGYLLRVADDGVGLGQAREVEQAAHLGVSMMAERAAMAGGWCHIESPDGRPGTTVVAWMPDERAVQEGACDAADPRPDR
jgi:signal transduction histidine kinase